MSDIIKTQRSLATKAVYNPQHQFDHLYRLICREDWIRAALKSVLSNKGAKTAGIDGVTKKELNSQTAKAEFVSELQSELRSRQFKPKPVRRVYIPKANGKCRPLGIANVVTRWLSSTKVQLAIFVTTCGSSIVCLLMCTDSAMPWAVSFPHPTRIFLLNG
ncbi:MAG: hypothetical protein NHB32_06230 [Fischerella sp. CENA71]|nr:hypothetical protein [Fischerella sp. CENA71]